MTATTTRLGHALKRIWSGLPDGPLGERELEERILEITGAYEGDFAQASALRASLVACQAMRVQRSEDGKLEYVRGEWTDWPANGPGSAGFNAELAARSQEHEELMRQQDEAHAQALASAPWGVQRRQILEAIDQRVTERLAAVERELSELRQQLTAADDSE